MRLITTGMEKPKLRQLIAALDSCDLQGIGDQVIRGLAYDSRKIEKGYLFVALKGHVQDGHRYIDDAIQRGASAVVAERIPKGKGEVAMIRVTDSRKALSRLAIEYYERPFLGMNTIGITGTNGKTTTSFLLEQILTGSGRNPGVVGTINYRFSGKAFPAPMTTPESLDLMRLLREMADHGASDAIVEVSSHALDQGRVEGCPFTVAVFTNLTRDHLDYHHTMDAYFEAKSRLFKDLGKKGGIKPGTAVINLDDPRGRAMAAVTQGDVVFFGLDPAGDFHASSIKEGTGGLEATLSTPVGKRSIRSSLLGCVNIYNILAAAAAAVTLGVDLDEVVDGIASLQMVPGRLEPVQNRRGLKVVVDYAHTPDALYKTIEALKPLTAGLFITVFGCGGDRDQGKRFEMGEVAGTNSDLVLITSDNPRTEDPLFIIRQIEEGVRKGGLHELEQALGQQRGGGYFIESDRRKAIRKALGIAQDEDLVLVAGKGHEDYQIIGSEKRPFDDREEVRRALEEMS
jgi:UDP-N-acetylmuramoyl-L-alanyl-D-glutamate--2,6-diaminopimelate ligase